MNNMEVRMKGIDQMKKRVFAGLLLVLAPFVLAGCGKPYLSVLRPAGEVGEKQLKLIVLTLFVMAFVVVTVVTIYLIILLRFRRKKEDGIPKQVEGSTKLEIIWTAIPILIVLGLGIPTIYYTAVFGDVSGMEQVDEDGNRKNLVINVRANLYWWEFEYPDYGIVTSQDLIVPTDEKIYFNLIASDVKHSFWIPSAGGKMDTNTDNENRFYLVFDSEKADEAGNLFYGKCAELCGPSHSYMDFKVKAVSREQFDAWVKAMQSDEGPELTSDLAVEGQRLFEQNNCLACHAVTAKDERPASARIAPNLADFGNRSRVAGYLQYNKENIKNWIRHPEEYKPGNKMYKEANFTDQELDALAEYLMSLKVQ
jgi:cytochrome c oxidase, subunit II